MWTFCSGALSLFKTLSRSSAVVLTGAEGRSPAAASIRSFASWTASWRLLFATGSFGLSAAFFAASSSLSLTFLDLCLLSEFKKKFKKKESERNKKRKKKKKKTKKKKKKN